MDGIRVDIMPVDPGLLGFSNVWYPGGIAHAKRVAEGLTPLRILDAPHFCATKLEAFNSRGGGDFYHHDIEDFIAIVDGRPELREELAHAPADLREFLAVEVGSLLSNTTFLEALPGNLAGDEASQARLPLVLARLRAIAALHTVVAPKPRLATPSLRGAGRAALPPVSMWHPIRSSNLRAVAYDEANQLFVEFEGGAVYVYANVPSTLYAGLMGAASAGRYHHQWIRKRYRYRRVR